MVLENRKLSSALLGKKKIAPTTGEPAGFEHDRPGIWPLSLDSAHFVVSDSVYTICPSNTSYQDPFSQLETTPC